MEKGKHKEEMVVCPVGRFFANLERVTGRGSTFHKHLNQSSVEFLKAIRSLVDERIETLEKMATKKGKRMTKIKVE